MQGEALSWAPVSTDHLAQNRATPHRPSGTDPQHPLLSLNLDSPGPGRDIQELSHSPSHKDRSFSSPRGSFLCCRHHHTPALASKAGTSQQQSPCSLPPLWGLMRVSPQGGCVLHPVSRRAEGIHTLIQPLWGGSEGTASVSHLRTLPLHCRSDSITLCTCLQITLGGAGVHL